MRTRKLCLLPGPLCGFVLAFALVSQPAGAQTSFGSVNLGSNSTVTVNVPIALAGTLSDIAVVTQGAPNLDYTNAGGGTCATGAAYAANATCTVQVSFAPQFAGARYGAVVLSDASGVVGTTYLQGTGVGPQTTLLPSIQSTIATFTSDITWTSGVAVDGSGNVYITNYDRWGCGSAQLIKETLSGGSYIESVVPTSTMNCPYGVAVDGAGNIYVTDTSDWRVLKETPFAGGYIESIVASFPAVDGTAPIGVAVDGAGDVYISLGSDGGTVVEETPAATGYTQSTVVSGLCCVAGVAVDGNGNVYAAVNETDGWIVKETPSAGGYTQSTISVSSGGVPFGVAVDGSGNVYVAFTDSNDNGQVFKETVTEGGYTQSTIPTSGLDQPGGVAADGAGNIYIADSYNSRIVMETIPPSFSVAASPASLTITAGQSGTTSISVTPLNGFDSAVSFSCSGLPSGATCSFFPQTVTPSGGAASTTLTVTTSASMAAFRRHAGPLLPMSALAALVCSIGWKRRRLAQILPLIVVGAIGFGLLNGCGSGGSSGGGGGGGSQSVTSTVTVTATSGSLQHTTPFSLTVN